jgi:hypothetical protein
MHAAPPPLLRSHRAAALERPLVLWLLALVVLLKTAVPLLASAAAAMRGVALVEVCTVYGVHTQRLQAHDEPAASHGGTMDHHTMVHDMAHHAAHGMSEAPADGHSPAAALEHREHCALSPLLGHAIAAAPSLAPVLLHAPARAAKPVATRPVTPGDAGRAWLAQRFHAPPLGA